MRSDSAFHFEVVARDSASGARLGRFYTPHGVVETPAFMPVGTQATVKTVDPRELRTTGAQMILSNTYHLALRPGAERIRSLGGLHRFMGWNGPILTDSGGFQIWSLADRARGRSLVRLDDDGATFTSHLDGRRLRFTPESAIDTQATIGADVIMAFDECTSKDADEATARGAADRTHRWAHRCRAQWQAHADQGMPSQALFGIVQGGNFRHLRRWSTEEIASLDLPGIAIGGESIGYSKGQTADILDWIVDLLPLDRPRYAMGVGDPVDFTTVVERGIDLFDSVLPTRLARNGALLTRSGRLRIESAACRSEEGPIDPECRCLACREFSRAYLHHLYRAGELLGHRLGTLHNLTYCLDVTREMREALRNGCYGARRHRWSKDMVGTES
jgi:queuine tRNA-ribosyltransferase